MKELLIKSLICIMALTIFMNFLIVGSCIAGEGNFDLKAYDTTADASIKSPFEGVIGAILGVMRIVGTGVAFIIIMVVAIKYMSAAPGERADIKKSSIQFVVGAVILFASTNILDILVKVFANVFPES